MSERPGDPSADDREADVGSDDDEADAASTLAAAAPGESVTADRLRDRLVGEGDPARLLDVLAPDEKPQYLLDGVMADRVREDGERSRRMATPGGSAFTLVTDRAVHVVVQYRDRLAVETVPLALVDGTTVQRAGEETRLGIDTGDARYEVYPSGTPTEEVEAAAAYLDGREGGANDAVSALERLAGLYERGLLTDEEFAAAKRDLLD
ncbi:SHOCT domain-containing protein [Salinigranum rubrum]|nr:SHOCT domain-containing protein [Salinigranum rubrum]